MMLGKNVLLWIFAAVFCGAQGAENLLVNAGFEEVNAQGGFPGWRVELEPGTYAGSARNMAALEKKNCLELCCPEVGQSGAVIQRCQVVPGKEYLFSGLFSGKNTYARINCLDAAGNFVGCAAQIDLTIEPDSYTWKCVNRSFTLPANTAYVDVIFDMWARVCQGSGYADMLYLGEKPSICPETPVVHAQKQDGGVTLAWKPCSNAVQYLIYKADFSDRGRGEAMALVSGTSWQDTAIDKRAARAFYRVIALDAAGQTSEISASAEVILHDFPPASPTYVGVFSPFQKIRKYQFLLENPTQKITLDLAKNETAAAQILVSNPGRTLHKVDVSVKDLKINGALLTLEQAAVELFREHYVMVDVPSVARPEMLSSPGFLPDALLPWQEPVTVAKGENQGIWFKLCTGQNCPAGKLTGEVVIREADRVVAVLPIEGTVYDFALPETPSYRSSFNIRYDRIQEAFGFDDSTPETEVEAVYDRYIEMLLEHRLNPLFLPYPWQDARAQKFLRDKRVNSLGLPTGNWGELGEIAARWKRDYDISGYVYIDDEPGEGDFPCCREHAELVHRNPGVPYLLTAAPNPELYGAVDIWVPSLQDLCWPQIAARRVAGEHIWWYTSLVPRAPFPTLLVDDCGTSPRALVWLQAKYNIEGLLYWDICMHRRLDDENAYDGEVWNTPRLYREGNGDGFLVYPGKVRGIAGPVTSIRFEELLEGLEELEYFTLYRRLLAKKGFSEREINAQIDEIIQPAAQGLTRWSPDFAAFDRQRGILVQKIFSLEHSLKR